MPNDAPHHDSAADPDRINSRQDFGQELTALRERAGLTVRDVARVLGVPASTLGGYFSGRNLPPVTAPALLENMLFVFGVDDAAVSRKWLDALSRVRRAPGRRPTDAPIPYRGLESFQPEDAEWFYGRQGLTAILVGHLRQQYKEGGLLFATGPSGSGKSSVLRAGLIPALHDGALDIPGSATWPVTLLTPGAEPVRELAVQLATMSGDDPYELAASLRAQPSLCRDLARQIASLEDGSADPPLGEDSGQRARLVIVVDQFEEVFTVCQDISERIAFITALCALAGRAADGGALGSRDDEPDADPAALVALGLRADFYPHALRHPALLSELQQHQVLVGPLTEDELRSVIVEPARKARLDIEDGLVEILLRDLAPAPGRGEPAAAHDAGTLPLLSHTLLTTWERSRRGRLTVADYQGSGGIEGAVARTAEEVYGELTASQQDLARQIFVRMVHVADDTADTRRRVPRSELLLLRHGDAQPVLDAFVAKRLITAESDDVEIAHETLLLAWPRLREWLDNDRAGVRIHRQLTTAAEIWRESGHDPGALYGGGRLASVEEWAADPAHAGDLNMLERQFLVASAERRTEEERTSRNRTRRLQRLVAALAVLSLVAGYFAADAYQQEAVARRQRDLAISRQVAIEANQLKSSDVALAMQLSLAAYRISPTAEAFSSLLDSTTSTPATRLLGPVGTEAHSVAIDSAKALLASGYGNGTVRLWDISHRGHPRILGRPIAVSAGGITSVAFSGGGVLAAGGATGSVWLWDVDNRRRPVLLSRLNLAQGATVNSVAFSHDGRTLAVAGSDGKVYLWTTADPHQVSRLGPPLTGCTGGTYSVAFSPDSRLVAIGGPGGCVRLIHLTHGAPRTRTDAALTGPVKSVNAVAFSPDSRTLAAGGSDDTVWRWSVGSGRKPAPDGSPLRGPASWIYSVAFSPDGRTIAAAGADNTAYVWSASNGVLLAALPHPAPVLAVTYGADDYTVATSDADGVVRLWTLPGPILTGSQGSAFTTAFSPDSGNLAVASGDGTIQLWNVARPGRPFPDGPPLRAPGPALDGTLAYGPGGRLAAGGGDGSIHMWDVSDVRHPAPLRAPATALNTPIQYVAFDRSGRLMAAGSSDGRIEIWGITGIAHARPAAVLGSSQTGQGHDTFAVAFSPDDHLLAAASADGTVRLWNITSPHHPRPLGRPLISLTSAVYQVTFSPDGHLLAASGEDGDVRLWNVADPGHPHLVSTMSRPTGIVYDVAFSPDGRTIATANGDKTVSLWNISDPVHPVILGTLTGPSGAVFAATFSPSGTMIAASSQDNTTRLWFADPSLAAAYICSVAGDAITRAEWDRYIPGLPYDPPCRHPT